MIAYQMSLLRTSTVHGESVKRRRSLRFEFVPRDFRSADYRRQTRASESVAISINAYLTLQEELLARVFTRHIIGTAQDSAYCR